MRTSKLYTQLATWVRAYKNCQIARDQGLARPFSRRHRLTVEYLVKTHLTIYQNFGLTENVSLDLEESTSNSLVFHVEYKFRTGRLTKYQVTVTPSFISDMEFEFASCPLGNSQDDIQSALGCALSSEVESVDSAYIEKRL